MAGGNGPSILQVVVIIGGAVAGGWLGAQLRTRFSKSTEEEMERRVQMRMEDIRRESVESSSQRPERPATVPPGDRA
ncbi:hypothetical protein FNF27_00308 [Cafeteria roenbergensis]|uniref:Uncharacterized protein n=1 Tax=Cafeteria roenbergensis TaxID=33653 RepID=A0A5A8CUD3_CAFRO|nr:hypothetical protein FNF29_01442 [Cafeteria roenbergensis]KAA0171769.1 hypothetical protein FNF28_00405 [Cafeteria roenbergensis]KAA0178459.1 hypothetical protein FNF27_00308 [Cafeteria roenbergensis]|eukprot:KAA0156024.1 hypothetical protein FNF29_01442 [Cafeteria roenbergensis]